jgi:AcrR family transcriptional regulator
MSSTKARPYRMQRRAEQVDATRDRITAATARLHTTVGPANTSVAAIAEEAGVTRLTVYRHFADLDVLFEACRAHWRAENPPPDISAWTGIPDLETRARTALSRLYGWFRDHADELFPIYRDFSSMPASSQERTRAENRRVGDLLIGDAMPAGAAGRRVRAAARHVLDYRTWRSLAIDQELGDVDAVEVGVALLATLAAVPADRRPVRPRRCRGGA